MGAGRGNGKGGARVVSAGSGYGNLSYRCSIRKERCSLREPLCLNGRVGTQGKISGFYRLKLFEPKQPFAGLIAGPSLPWVYEAAAVHTMLGSQFFKPRPKFSIMAVTAVPLSFGPQLETTLKELGFTAPALSLLGTFKGIVS